MVKIINLTQNHIYGYVWDIDKKLKVESSFHLFREEKMENQKNITAVVVVGKNSGSNNRSMAFKQNIKNVCYGTKYIRKEKKHFTGNYMSNPKSSWCNIQNAPPKVFQFAHCYYKKLLSALNLGEKNANEYQGHSGRTRVKSVRTSQINGYNKSNNFSMGAWRARHYLRNLREIIVSITDYDCPNSRSNWVNFINEQSV